MVLRFLARLANNFELPIIEFTILPVKWSKYRVSPAASPAFPVSNFSAAMFAVLAGNVSYYIMAHEIIITRVL